MEHPVRAALFGFLWLVQSTVTTIMVFTNPSFSYFLSQWVYVMLVAFFAFAFSGHFSERARRVAFGTAPFVHALSWAWVVMTMILVVVGTSSILARLPASSGPVLGPRLLGLMLVH